MRRLCMLVVAGALNIGFAADGEELYSKYGCYGCHGAKAQGSASFPKLANKPQSYLVKKLKGYKSGTIHSNRADTMKPFAKKLSDKEIEELAHYLSNIKEKDNEERYYEEFEVGDSSGS